MRYVYTAAVVHQVLPDKHCKLKNHKIMPVAAKNPKILVVDTSTAMLHVLKIFSDSHSYESDSFSDPAEACKVLDKRFEKFDDDYRCVLMGWPEGSIDIISDLLGRLSSTDHQDLPLLIVCQEMTTEIRTIVKRRAGTRALLWKDYQTAAEHIDRFALSPAVDRTQLKPSTVLAQDGIVKTRSGAAATAIENNRPKVATATNIKALLLDNTPSVNRVLRDLMEDNGYQVTLASSVADGRKALEKREFDLVVTDFFLRGEGGEELCRYLQSAGNLAGPKPVCVVVSSKYSDAIVKRSLAVGAVSCLDKDESTELLFARIDALVRTLPSHKLHAGAAGDTQSAMLELANDAAVLIDHLGVIRGLNMKARSLLDDINKRELTGREFSSLVCDTPIVIGKPQKAGFLTSSGSEVVVSYKAQHVNADGEGSGVLLTFIPQPVTVAKDKKGKPKLVFDPVAEFDSGLSAPAVSGTVNRAGKVKNLAGIVKGGTPEVRSEQASIDKDDGAEIKPLARPTRKQPVNKEAGVASIAEFMGELDQVITERSGSARHCVLMLDIQLIAATGDRMGLGHSEPMLKIVQESLAKLYPRENSFTYLGDGQFGFVLATRRFQDSLVLTRKLLSLIPKLVQYLSNMTLVSHGAVLQLSEDTPTDSAAILEKCRQACSRTRQDNRDNAALVMPMKKYLSAEPEKKNASRKGLVGAE